MPSVYGPALECRLSSLQHPGCPWPSHILEPVHVVSLVSPMPAPAQRCTAIDQLSAFLTVISGTVHDLLAASLRQQQPGTTWQAVSVAPGDVVCINAPGSLHIGANASSYSQLGLQGTCVGPAAGDPPELGLSAWQQAVQPALAQHTDTTAGVCCRPNPSHPHQGPAATRFC